MQFTNQCAGDLGIKVKRPGFESFEPIIVAMWFERPGNWLVFDLVRGGYPATLEHKADALNAMLEIAKREESTVS